MAANSWQNAQELAQLRRENPKPDDCDQCKTGTPVSHWPSQYCKGGNAPGRPVRAHCTCDLCW